MTYGRQRGRPVPDGITLRPPGQGDHPPPYPKGGEHSRRSTSLSVPMRSFACGPPPCVASAEVASMGHEKFRAGSPTTEYFTLKEPSHNEATTGPPGIRLPHAESMRHSLAMCNGPPGVFRECEAATLDESSRKEQIVQEDRPPPGGPKLKEKPSGFIPPESSHTSCLREQHERRRRPWGGRLLRQTGVASGRGSSLQASINFITRSHPHGSN